MDRILTLEQIATEHDGGGRRTAALFVAGIVIGALVLGGVVWMTGPGLAPNAPPGGTTVVIKNFAFTPAVLTVPVGATVTWVNQDSVYHTATSDIPAGLPDSPNINPGESWSFTFTQDGTYEYHCTPHPFMTGKIVVGTGQGSGGEGPLDIPHPRYDPATQPLPPGWHEWNFTLRAREVKVSIANGVPYAAWTFDGTLPGPTFRVRQGDLVHIRLVNEGTMNHSIDFHSARINWATAYRDVKPGDEHTYSFTADYPGVFMYHCGSAPVLAHVANGMYGMMIVEPQNDTRLTPDREYALVLSELYASDSLNAERVYFGDINKMLAATPTQVVFNGYAFQYHPGFGGQPLTAGAGQRVRLYVLNAGPSIVESFHVIGGIFDRVWIENNPANGLEGIQTWTLPASGGAAFEIVFPDAGSYPFVTHNFAYTGLGAVGVLQVT